MNFGTALKFVYAFGIPAVIAIYLIWFVVSVADARLQSIDSNLRAHQIDMSYTLKTNEELKAYVLNMNLILQKICVNTATNQSARNNCFGNNSPQ